MLFHSLITQELTEEDPHQTEHTVVITMRHRKQQATPQVVVVALLLVMSDVLGPYDALVNLEIQLVRFTRSLLREEVSRLLLRGGACDLTGRDVMQVRRWLHEVERALGDAWLLVLMRYRYRWFALTWKT